MPRKTSRARSGRSVAAGVLWDSPKLGSRATQVSREKARRRADSDAPAPPVVPTEPAPSPPLCAPPVPINPVTHPIARCRWCGNQFYRVHALPPQWLCLTPACADRQVQAAIPRLVSAALAELEPPGQSPWLFLPLPLNIDLAESPYKRTLLAGSAGSSKSYGARWMAYRECLARPGLRVLLLRRTFPELEKNHTDFMAAEALALQRYGHGSVKYFGGYYKSMTFGNNAKIITGHCQHDTDVVKLLGSDFDLILIDEAVNFTEKALAEIPPRDRGSPTARALGATDGKTWLLSNPGGIGMLMLSDFYITKTPDRKEYPTYDPAIYGYIHGAIRDSPYLAPDYVKKNLSGLSAARFKQLADGDWTVFQGQFLEFDPTVHVKTLMGVA